ncbi:MAG TPA: hypothetical protein VMD49_09995 [Steroidobacteraceae bacterium]|jgi:hypothetical protein|nr:hypothetical protein [Steroidobacteraceae bacterium]
MLELSIAIGANLLIGALAALLILRAGNRRAQEPRLADPGAALELFRDRFPEAAGVATITADGRNALIELRGGSGIGLLQGHGLRWNARVLEPGDLASVRACAASALRLKFADYGGPRASLSLAHPDERSAWLARLQVLAGSTRRQREGSLHHA